ncbi:hypothetical protein GN277_13170 [Lachnospiraceae bacterium WCA-9-b2]|uniref:Uncharacterized protein n=1 Tax=Sporofaciens musculi TaxID=2681861 RepID=A0A7X3MH45_9FIRM|nr:hypothetical protein [Sporofaciens musculi]MXP76309.1 hypothetical protein [Sporofaciens musculi]
MKRAVKEVLKFEVIFKRITLCLVNPLLNEIYQTYVSSKGVSFNKDMIGTFMSVKGALIREASWCSALSIIYCFCP